MNAKDTVTLPVMAVQDMLHCIQVLNEVVNDCILTEQQEERVHYVTAITQRLQELTKDLKK